MPLPAACSTNTLPPTSSPRHCKENATVEACSVLSDCRKAGVPDEGRRNSVGSDQRAPTTKNESDNSGTEGGEELLQPAPRSRLASCSSTLLSAMLALLSSFAFASRDSSLRTSSLEHPPRSARLPLCRPSRRSTAVGLAQLAPALPSLGFSRPALPPGEKSRFFS